MEGSHKTITKLSKLNIVVGVVSFVTMLIYIILASTIRMNETNIFITYFFTVVIPTLVYLFIDVIIGIYALANQKKFYRNYIPYGIAVSCLLAFFSYPYIGIIGMIANISLCKVDIRESEWCGEGRSLINDPTTTTTAIISTTTDDADISSSGSVPMYSIPPNNVSSPAAQNPYMQPTYYGAPAQYPTYAQQKPSAQPLQQQHTTIDILPPSQPQQPAQPYETPAVPSIYPNMSSLPDDSAPTAPPAMSVNAESYGYTPYNYDPK